MNGETMTRNVLLLTSDDNLITQLQKQAGEQTTLSCFVKLDDLLSELKSLAQATVVLHLTETTLEDRTAGRFAAELNDSVDNATLVALIDNSCPVRLRKLMEKSSDHCLPMPLNTEQIHILMSDEHRPEDELAGFWLGLPHKELHGKSRTLVTFTPEMFVTIDEVKVAAKHNVTVLLIGETGSGKTHLARLIHEVSNLSEERLSTVACGALPPDLIESELFGYVKGAFTGADRDKQGKFAAAGSGTLLLDEIDVLSLDQQAKLLRVIETGEYEPVGSNEVQMSQARLIVASNYNLEDLVQKGTFRTDLYYRLNILKFHLLPLRERPWDIEYLARKFALEHSRTHEIPLREIDPGFLDALRRYHWPGNIREMENVIRRAVLYCQRGVLAVKDLPSSVRDAAANPGWLPQGQPGAIVQSSKHHLPTTLLESQAAVSRGEPLEHHGFHRSSFAGGDPTSGAEMGIGGESGEANHAQPKTLEARVHILERRIIEDCLRRNNHRRKETAAELGISRVTLYNKMKKFGLMG